MNTNEVILNNGAAMPRIGLGVYRLQDHGEAVQAVRSALEQGYRHIDTASYYQNERAVGQAVRESGIPREEIFITTKLWNEAQRTGSCRQAFEESLEKLGVGYIDLYLVHWPVAGLVAQTWYAMEELYASGKVEAIGVSNHRIGDLQQILDLGGVIPAVNQIELHPYLAQDDLVGFCREEGITVQAWSPLAAKKAPLLEEPSLLELAAKHGKSPAQIVLRWDIQRGVVPLPKSANPGRQRDNLNIFDFELDGEDMRKIAALDCGRRIGPDPANVTF